jgi:hypothetical protein
MTESTLSSLSGTMNLTTEAIDLRGRSPLWRLNLLSVGSLLGLVLVDLYGQESDYSSCTLSMTLDSACTMQTKLQRFLNLRYWSTGGET